MSPPSIAFRAMWYATVGVTVAVTAAGCVAGHLLRIHEMTEWWGGVPMAINTALCMLLMGAAWITHAADVRFSDPTKGAPHG